MRTAAARAAPAEKHSTDEIVKDIMDLVDYPPETLPAKVEEALEVYVRKLIDDLCAKPSLFAGDQRVNKEYLSDLREWAVKSKKLLLKAPKPLRSAVFSSEMFGPLYLLHGTALGINPETRAYLDREPVRLGALIGELDRIRARCDELARHGLGKDSRVRPQQRHAAIASRTILEALTAFTGKKLSLSRLPTSKFCKIASLFYEAATGEHGKDLVRACEAVARDPYASGPLFTRNG